MKPICVDLDNTLIFSDSMFLLWLKVLKKSPMLALYVIYIFFFNGSAEAKHFITCHGNLDIENLPYNQNLVSWLVQKKEQGHAIWLVTGANQFIANRIALHLPIFDGVLASDKQNNLIGEKKASCLKNHFSSFIYIGDHKKDLVVWAEASESGIVCKNKKPPFKGTFKYIFNRPQATLKDWAKLLRIDHWPKNLLIWLPMLFQYKALDSSLFLLALLATICLCLFASVGYICDDAINLNQGKKKPFVTGLIDIPQALQIASLILVINLCLMSFLPNETKSFLITYFIAALCFSLLGKNNIILDVFLLASFYAIRVEIGCTLIAGICSPELTLSILFSCLGLACAKQLTSLKKDDSQAIQQTDNSSNVSLLSSIGISISGIGVMMFADFLRHFIHETSYAQPNYLFLCIPLLLYWQYKFWHCCFNQRSQNIDGTTMYKDTYIVSSLLIIIIFLAA